MRLEASAGIFTDHDAVVAGSGGQCAAAIPPIVAVSEYPIKIYDLGAGVAQTALDVIDRYIQASGYKGLGLRGVPGRPASGHPLLLNWRITGCTKTSR